MDLIIRGGYQTLLLLLADKRRPGAGYLATPLIRVAALGVAAAYLAGQAQAEAFEHGLKEWLVQVHEGWGIAVMITPGLWAVSRLWPRIEKYRWMLDAVGSVMALIAAFYGGLVAHGQPDRSNGSANPCPWLTCGKTPAALAAGACRSEFIAPGLRTEGALARADLRSRVR